MVWLKGQGARWRRGSSLAGWVGAVTTWLRLFFFRSIFFKSILFRGGARAAAEKRDTPALSEGVSDRREGAALRRPPPSAPRALLPGSPRTLPRPPCALPPPSPPRAPDNFRGGVQRKFAALAAGLPASWPRRLAACARLIGLAQDRVLPRDRHHEQALHRQPQRERDPRGLGESICGAQDLLQWPVLGQIRLCLRRLPRRALGDEGHRNFLG